MTWQSTSHINKITKENINRFGGFMKVKKRISFIVILLSLIVVVFMSCSNSTTKPPEPDDGLDVYVSYVVQRPNFLNDFHVLKNGSPMLIIQSLLHLAPPFFVYENDIYVLIEHGGSTIIYKNGNVHLQIDGKAAPPQNLFVFEGDVYSIIIFNNETAVLKNSQVIHILGSWEYVWPRSIFVYEGDVYVADNTRWGIKLWKNGEMFDLPESYKNTDFGGTVFVSNGNVYVAGAVVEDRIELPHRAILWKNGAAIRLHDEYSYALSIYVENGNTYVAGRTGAVWNATVWINGNANILSTNFSNALSVHVSDNEVFVAGSETIEGRRVATLWRNGIAQRLHRGRNESFAPGVFVVRQ